MKKKDERIVLYYLVGKRIRQRREQAELTQDDLAKAIGLQRTSLVNIEAGMQHIALDALYKIAHLLDCPIADFLPAWSPRLCMPLSDMFDAFLETGHVPDELILDDI